MKNKIIKNFTWWFGVIFMGVILGMSLQFTRAWTNPPSPPPVDNLGAPINTSLNTQYKSGALGIGGILKTYSNLYVDGKVGMGTNNPGHEIHILASAEPQIYLESTGDGTGAALRLDDGNGSDWKIKVDGGNQNFKIRDHANKSDVFTIEDGTGRVGVGTTSPTEKLDVQGNIKASGTVCDSNGCIGGKSPTGLSCHIVSKKMEVYPNFDGDDGLNGEKMKVYCDSGVRTGGGCRFNINAGHRKISVNMPIENNGWYCVGNGPAVRDDGVQQAYAYVVCCE
jgi:hypothetical protein